MRGTMFGIAAVLLAAHALVPATARAMGSTPPGISVTLTLDHPTYLPGETILATLAVRNGDQDVIARKGFMDQDFRLTLAFTDEAGNVITTFIGTDVLRPEPRPPIQLPIADRYLSVDEVEVVPANWAWVQTFDVTQFYHLTRTLHYTVKAAVPIRTFGKIDVVFNGIPYAEIEAARWWGLIESEAVPFALTADLDLDGFLAPVSDSRLSAHPETDCDDADAAINPGMSEVPGNGLDDDCNPATLDEIQRAPGSIKVQADRHSVGAGSYPGSAKSPLVGLPVRVFDKSPRSCAGRIGISWQSYEIIWKSCPAVEGGVGWTDGTGALVLPVPPGTYLLIGVQDPDGSTSAVPLSYSGDEIFLGASVGPVAPGEETQRYLQMIQKADGSSVPAKYELRTGSQLLIIEPEYTEWDGASELYPFIFESVGAWTVTTALTPPEGFVADQPALTAEVASSERAVQFEITDVGSRWVGTGVTHTVKHKGKSETIRGRVGVKLSERLAKQKGIGRFGDEPPGIRR